MRGFNSASIDLIYLDPPFNSKADYAAPIGSKAAGAVFKDTWTLDDVDVEWINLIEAKHPALYRVLLAAMTNSDKSYLAYMATRLLEMHRILKPTGSIYLHCDSTMSHYLKLVMDAIFGRKNFRNEFIWIYEGRELIKTTYNRRHDNLLFYSKGKSMTFNWKNVATPLKESSKKAMERFVDEDGKSYVLRYKKGGGFAPKEKDGSDGVYRQYPSNTPPRDWLKVDYARKSERTGYPTQKPLALLTHIIKASSNAGDIVLDPFCGCATTCVAAEQLGRGWIGIDISAKAAELVKIRAENELTDLPSSQKKVFGITHRTDIPKRTDMGKLPSYKTHKKTLYSQQGGNCAGCKTHFEIRHFDVDHIIARAKGGTDHIDNLQLLCGSCNSIKGARSMEYLKTKLDLLMP